MNSSNTYSPLYSSYENINIYKKNKKIQESFDTSTANISCDSKGRILIKDNENERKSSESKNKVFSSYTSRNITKHENYDTFWNNEMKKESNVIINNCDKNNFIYDNVPTKNYLNSGNIHIMDYENYFSIVNNNNNYKKYGNNYINSNGKELNNHNNRKQYNSTNLINNNHLYNNSLNNLYEENANTSTIDQFNRNIYVRRNRNYSYDNNKYTCNNNNNNNPIFLNTYPPIYFCSNNGNNIKSNNYFTYNNVLHNMSYQKYGFRNNGNFHLLKYVPKSDRHFAKTISKVFNRKKEINKSRINSLNSSEFLKEFEKLKKSSSVNKNSVSAVLQKKKVSTDTSNTKSKSNNTLNKIYNFIFPSSIKKSQNQNNLDKNSINKECTKSSLKDNQNNLMDKSKERVKVSFGNNDNNNTKGYHQNCISHRNQGVRNNVPYFNEKEDTKKLLFFNSNSFIRNNKKECSADSKNVFLGDKHKYHEKIITSIYQFTGASNQKEWKVKNVIKPKSSKLKEDNNENNKNGTKQNLSPCGKHKNGSDALLEKEKIQNRIIEKVTNNINQKIKMNHASINGNELGKNENKDSYPINNVLQKPKNFSNCINADVKKNNYNNSLKTYNNNNSTKQNLSNYNLIKQDSFNKESENISKNALHIKNEDDMHNIQNKNDPNLAFEHANKYINNIFKNNNIGDASKEDRFMNNFSKNENIHKSVKANENMQNSFSEKDNIITEGISDIFESEKKKNDVLKSKSVYAHENTKMNVETKNNLISYCHLNKFFFEKNNELRKLSEKDIHTNENIKAENFKGTYISDNKLKNSSINNYINKNTVMKFVENNKMNGNITNVNNINVDKKEEIVPNNSINENNQKCTFLNLLNNEIKSVYDNNTDDHFYVHSIVSITDKENSLKAKNNSQKVSNEKNDECNFSREDNKSKISLRKNPRNNTFFQEVNKNVLEKRQKLKIKESLMNDKTSEKIYNNEDMSNIRSVNYNADEISLLKSKVYDELNACVKCVNNLTKNKKLFEQLKKYTNKLDKKIKLEKVPKIKNSNLSESYYTINNSYISSYILNENKNNKISNINNDLKSHNGDNNIIMNSKTGNSKNITRTIDNNKEKLNRECGYSEEKSDILRNSERSVHPLSFCNDKTTFHLKSNIENRKDQKKALKINVSDKYFLSETEKPYIGKKKALLITLNYNGLLEGCISDTLDLCKHLVENFEFNELILLNDCNIRYKNSITQKANKKNILNELNNFIINSNNGDVLFFYFCGYSIKLIDLKFSEIHNFALLPQDHSKSNYIYSNEIFNIIKKLEGGKQLCVIFDTTYTSYFVPVFTSITYNKNLCATELYKKNYLEFNKPYFNSFRTFGKIRDRHVDSVHIEELQRPLDYELHNDKDENQKIKKPLSPSIFFFSPDIKDRNSYELLIKQSVRGLLTYCICKSIELLKGGFSYHDLFVVASKLLIHIKNEYKIKYINFKLSFSSEHSPDDIKFLSHESLFFNKKKKHIEEPLWKESIRLYNLNKYIKDIHELKEKRIQKNTIKKCLIIFIKDIKFCTFKNIDTTVEYFISCFLKSSNINILYVKRNNTKSQKIVQDKIFFLEYIKLNLSDLENTRIYLELFKKKKKNYFIARSVFNIRSIDGKFSLTDEKKNIVGIIDLTIKCFS